MNSNLERIKDNNSNITDTPALTEESVSLLEQFRFAKYILLGVPLFFLQVV